MQEIAQATFTYEHFPEVMQMLWKRMLQDNKKNWRRTYKVDALLINKFGTFPISLCLTLLKLLFFSPCFY